MSIAPIRAPIAQATPEQQLLTPKQVAHALGLDQVAQDSERAVREMARRGELRAVRVGKWTMIDAASVDRFIRGERRCES